MPEVRDAGFRHLLQWLWGVLVCRQRAHVAAVRGLVLQAQGSRTVPPDLLPDTRVADANHLGILRGGKSIRRLSVLQTSLADLHSGRDVVRSSAEARSSRWSPFQAIFLCSQAIFPRGLLLAGSPYIAERALGPRVPDSVRLRHRVHAADHGGAAGVSDRGAAVGHAGPAGRLHSDVRVHPAGVRRSWLGRRAGRRHGRHLSSSATSGTSSSSEPIRRRRGRGGPRWQAGRFRRRPLPRAIEPKRLITTWVGGISSPSGRRHSELSGGRPWRSMCAWIASSTRSRVHATGAGATPAASSAARQEPKRRRASAAAGVVGRGALPVRRERRLAMAGGPRAQRLEDLAVAPATRWMAARVRPHAVRRPRSRRRARRCSRWAGAGSRSPIRVESGGGRADPPRASGRRSARRACARASGPGSPRPAAPRPSFRSASGPTAPRATGRSPATTSARRARRSPTPRWWAGRRSPRSRRAGLP